jgi:uncharacterized protein (TIGR00297 family)
LGSQEKLFTHNLNMGGL